MMVGTDMIFSNILVNAHPMINKNKVGKWAFFYIVSRLVCDGKLNDSYMMMCGCIECIGLQTLHHLL
jgi:hypothetical protein